MVYLLDNQLFVDPTTSANFHEFAIIAGDRAKTIRCSNMASNVTTAQASPTSTGTKVSSAPKGATMRTTLKHWQEWCLANGFDLLIIAIALSAMVCVVAAYFVR
jgi:hypothetical protein